MSRPTNAKRAEREIRRVIKWADTQGFVNIAEALRRVLLLLPDERGHRPKAKH